MSKELNATKVCPDEQGCPILTDPPPISLDALRDRALSSLPAWEKSERVTGIEHAGQRWLTIPLALQDIRDVLLAGAVPTEQQVTADRQTVPMTLPKLQSLWQAHRCAWGGHLPAPAEDGAADCRHGPRATGSLRQITCREIR
ncbi:DUF4376 domain-containing protein [Laribacter hongkongensis]|uniref:DUF4376 domain-containing protein n=1 Tax=Laribacter hongkongensis TaxID=168471 RepID=A0ABD4SRN5_9NEIS|nr:DUF4376 domain-containing protein [Laribacter hongkongensis]MCG9026425.1 DUF4376 domain-containing protein [Laribacter hongkongensis]MCG9100247.1 DUF4376 domain-containing protein [Laribacter hongkongensis]MCG9103178.1 DUF4376 domain-containing protein [Laribacter hongkongensis]MCG9112058.1 DUF4376 domain-containing protein [Laribacter hongkongensis]MCG9119380.1 DUF4376 domain-containing protein [Laribacter hongkongensis]